jgi:hypothetical protein
MRLTPRQLNRATLARQLLLQREPLPVLEAVHRLVAIQAQEPASPYIALWNRIADFDPADLDAAFVDHTVVKATLMRITLHAVAARDHRAFHEAMQGTLRGSRLHHRRFKSAGLPVAAADALVPGLLAFASQPRSVAELEEWVDEQIGVRPKPSVWWALRSIAPLVHAPTGAPWTFGPRPSYLAAPTPPATDEQAGAVEHLVRRYLGAFGPASVQDFAQFAMLRQPTVRPAFEALADVLGTFEGPGRAVLYDIPGAPVPDEAIAAPPRLMAMWDSTLLAYADRSRVIPPEYRPLVIRANGDVLATLLVDGFVCGVWRPVPDGIEATSFHPLPAQAWEALAAEARDLLGHLAARDLNVYRRYARWWTALPSAEVHILPP